jgi:hypothetical protein
LEYQLVDTRLRIADRARIDPVHPESPRHRIDRDQ